MQNELDISEADTIEFQRIHRIGRLNPSQDKPRPIIVRFLRYSDRELVMSRAKKLKGKGFGISADLPRDIVKRRKELTPKFKKAKEDGQSAFFKRLSQINCMLRESEFTSFTKLKNINGFSSRTCNGMHFFRFIC